MLYVTYTLNVLLLLALPVALGLFLTRKFGLGWRLFWIGAATFIGSQIVHLPVNAGLTELFARGLLPTPPAAWRLPFNAVVLGLTAGLSEEIARYLVYRYWIRPARTWREALLFGAGHGGIEAMIVGVLTGFAVVQLFALRDTDLGTLPLTPEQLVLLQQQLTQFWSAPWYATLLGALERVFALIFHLSMAVVVLQAVKGNNLLWLLAAVLWHAAVDAVAVFAVQTWGPYWTEVLIGIGALISLGFIFALKPAQEALPVEPVTVLPSTGPSPPADAQADLQRQLDDSRFSQ